MHCNVKGAPDGAELLILLCYKQDTPLGCYAVKQRLSFNTSYCLLKTVVFDGVNPKWVTLRRSTLFIVKKDGSFGSLGAPLFNIKSRDKLHHSILGVRCSTLKPLNLLVPPRLQFEQFGVAAVFGQQFGVGAYF
jgi:hypothetical protein